MPYHFKIISELKELPSEWDTVVAPQNLFLSSAYFQVLEDSKPDNMQCYAVAFYKQEILVGGALFQYLNFKKHSSFQQNTSWCDVRNYLIQKFSKDVLIIGNNMLTGQNGFYFSLALISPEEIPTLLEAAVREFQRKEKRTALIIFKDFQKSNISFFNKPLFKSYFKFSVQPTMILKVKPEWLTFEDYLAAFSKKYRARAKTARKKFEGLEKRELAPEDIKRLQTSIYKLYLNVLENAPFNTFVLTAHHFYSLKENMKENFRIFGYFKEDELVGFHSFICNKKDVDTYFLGYSNELQKQNQLYLNMLLDMVAFSIENKFEKIILGRTALEIKSTIGAEPVEISGLIKHNGFFTNLLMPKIFPLLEPKAEWLQRKPFK